MRTSTAPLSVADSVAREDLPVYQSEVQRVRQLLTENRSLGVLLVDASSLGRIENTHGKRAYREILTVLAGLISKLRGAVVRSDDIMVVNRAGGDQFFIFLGKKRDARSFCSSDLESLSERVSRELNEKIFPAVFPYLKGRPNVTVGHAIVIFNPLIEEENLIHRLLEDARTMARFQRFKGEIRNKEKLQEIIIKEDLTIVFQRIVELASGRTVGYEALSRGPKGSEYENPYFLFDIAREVGLIFELDRICRKKALDQASLLAPHLKLFVNCLPATIHDPEFQGSYVKDVLKDLQRSPSNVVMEVSEREAIDDYAAFRGALAHYADLGFSIAVDDTGAGYSSLEAIVELQPDYLKLDISMVRGIDSHLLKQEMIKAIVSFSKNMGATIIAEGIETQEELEILKRLGVPYGQGFLLGRPEESPTG